MSAKDGSALEDVMHALRQLARSYFTVAEAVVQVVESQLAMTIDISEQLRDSVISRETLEEARAEPLPTKLRHDSHRAVDVIADLGAATHVTAIRFVKGFGKGVG